MSDRLLANYLILACIIVLGYVGQGLIKSGLNAIGAFQFHSVGHSLAFLAQCIRSERILLGIVTVTVGFTVWLAFLSRVDFSQALLMLAFSYLPALIVGKLVFGEPLGALRVLGGVLITIGVLCVGWSR